MNSEPELLDIKSFFSAKNFIHGSKILSLKDREEWLAYLKRLPATMQDVYYTPEYYEVYEKNNDGKALCFIYEDIGGLALYPFLLSRINELGYTLNNDYYDIRGAYGYNGVIYNSIDPDFIKSFYFEFDKFCKRNNIIAEFTRFNPLLENHKFSKEFLDVSYNRETVYVDLTQSYEDIYKNFSHSAKGNLNRAAANDLTIASCQNKFPYKKEFIQMYRETMDRVQAHSYVYFDNSYFENSFNNLPVVHFVVFKESIPIASALCLISKKILHVHFEVSKTEYLIYRPNNFLFDEIIKYGIKEGLQIIHLGGGSSCKKDDFLLRFKKNFSKTTFSFYTGNRIHNQEIYTMVCEQWSNKFPELNNIYSDKFLRYRFIR